MVSAPFLAQNIWTNNIFKLFSSAYHGDNYKPVTWKKPNSTTLMVELCTKSSISFLDVLKS